MDFLMRSIHSHTAKTLDSSKLNDTPTTIDIESGTSVFTFKNASFSPPILIVGTNKQKLPTVNKNEIIEKKFEIIKEFLRSKIYVKHIVEPYFAIDTSDNEVFNEQVKSIESSGETNTVVYYHDIDVLRRTIKQVALNEPYMGEQQPLKWMNFEKSLEKLKSKGLFYASLSQVQ